MPRGISMLYSTMRMRAVAAVASFALLGAVTSAAASATPVDLRPGLPWFAFMNVFFLPADGGAFIFGNYWGITDLNATFSPGGIISLSPNTSISRDILPGNPDYSFWWRADGTGNRIMDANLLVQDDSLVGQTVTFSGVTFSNTLVSPYFSRAFIRDFVSDYSSFVEASAPLVGGRLFSTTLATAALPGHHVQYGFETNGPNAPLAAAGTLGAVQVAASDAGILFPQLLADVAGLGPAGKDEDLPGLVRLAQADHAAGRVEEACEDLGEFVDELRQLKTLAPMLTVQLTSESSAIQAVIGCKDLR